MPVQVSYPGVYIEEVPSGVRTITGVATSIAAFVGSAPRGPIDDPVTVLNFGDFQRIFGGLVVDRSLGYAVQQFFLNGGTQAIIVRVADQTAVASSGTVGGLAVTASSPGVWGDNVRVSIDLINTREALQDPPPATPTLFNLLAVENIDGNLVAQERLLNLSIEPTSPRFFRTVINQQSSLIRVAANATLAAVPTAAANAPLAQGAEPNPPGADDYLGNRVAKSGIHALQDADVFNLLILAPFSRDEAVADSEAGRSLISDAAALCMNLRAMLLVDPPTAWDSPADPLDPNTGISELRNAIGSRNFRNVSIFFPPPLFPDPLRENRLVAFPPSGAVAGVFARTDGTRGVWKAPAGITDGGITGAQRLSVRLTLPEIGRLNPEGINCLRTDTIAGNVVWGSRTLDGADALGSEWKYIPVRRLALFIEESLLRGTQFAVFEPNDEPLWSQLRLNIGTFMQQLFRRGAFQGQSPNQAYFVKVDSETTTQADIDLGIVNIDVGFKPLKPAEFVVIRIQQIAGQAEA